MEIALQVNKKPWLRADLVLRQKAFMYSRNIVASIRIDQSGGGNMSNYEQRMIEQMSNNPTAVLSWNPARIEGLKILRKRFDLNVASDAAVNGIKLKDTWLKDINSMVPPGLGFNPPPTGANLPEGEQPTTGIGNNIDTPEGRLKMFQNMLQQNLLKPRGGR